MLACPDRQVLADYALGKLSEAQASSLDEHVGSCPDCQDRLGSLGDQGDSLLQKLRQSVHDDGFSHEPECQQGLLLAAQAVGQRRWAADRAAFRAPEALRDYRILEPLGRGGMGSVYRALHVRLQKEVALKIIAPERRHSPAAARRFEQEMKAVGRLEHPHVVRATDAGEEDGLAYLAMELVAGIDLAALVRRRGPLPVAAACELARQAAEGLAYLHANQLVHRDVKPANLMLTMRGTVKILDLGLALLKDAEGGSATGAGHMLGTADYLAPEQIDSCHEVTGQADVYSLGCSLYELLAGRPPFSGEGYAATAKKIIGHSQMQAPPLNAVRADVPEELAALVEQMLAKQPRDRPRSAREVANRLAPLAAGADLSFLLATAARSAQERPLESELRTDSAGGAAFTPDTAAAEPPKTADAKDIRQPPRRRPWLALVLVGVSLMAAVVNVVRKGDAVRAWFRLEPGETVAIKDRDEPVPARGLAPGAQRGSLRPAQRPPAADHAPTNDGPLDRRDAPAPLRGLLPRTQPIEGIGPWQLHTVNPLGASSFCWSGDGRWLAVAGKTCACMRWMACGSRRLSTATTGVSRPYGLKMVLIGPAPPAAIGRSNWSISATEASHSVLTLQAMAVLVRPAVGAPT